ncbi:hypothetical protein SEVIR_8G009125v4 [Setaria viridis]|uniref:HIT domain-containing protein n=1 Tax=Setaria viridis TaxID=4556 RepID=A0A4U6TEC2_SETVI|nr:hypothetical protein SEVIR_8G009125v2 [Setaria viridis]
MLGGFSVLRSRAVLPLSLATPPRFLRRLPHPRAVSSSSSPPLQPPPGMEASYKFGPYKIDAREVFYATPLSYAMVNLRPLLPGHILLFSKAASVLSWKLDLGGLLWLWNWSCESIFFVLSSGAKLS